MAPQFAIALLLLGVILILTLFKIVDRKRIGSKQLPPQEARPKYPLRHLGGTTPIFHGVRVLELGTVVAAPTCGLTIFCISIRGPKRVHNAGTSDENAHTYLGSLLGSLGAEVVKVESFGGGDSFRKTFLAFEKTGGRRMGTMFENCNLNKRSIYLDLKSPSDMAKFWSLLRDCDVFITNVRAEALKRLGLDYETVRTQLPDLVYAQFSAWGMAGPDFSLPGYDVGAFWAATSLSSSIMDEGRHQLYPAGNVASSSYLMPREKIKMVLSTTLRIRGLPGGPGLRRKHCYRPLSATQVLSGAAAGRVPPSHRHVVCITLVSGAERCAEL